MRDVHAFIVMIFSSSSLVDNRACNVDACVHIGRSVIAISDMYIYIYIICIYTYIASRF